MSADLRPVQFGWSERFLDVKIVWQETTGRGGRCRRASSDQRSVARNALTSLRTSRSCVMNK